MGLEYLPAYFQEKLATVLWQAPKTWPLDSKEHVVLVQQTDGDPEIHPEEPLEPVNWKWGGFHSVGWFSIELQCLCRRNNQYHSKPPSQRTVTCTHSQPSFIKRCMILYNSHSAWKQYYKNSNTASTCWQNPPKYGRGQFSGTVLRPMKRLGHGPLTSHEAKWSDEFPVTHGLQPSMRCPLLCLIYVNGMPSMIKHSELSMLVRWRCILYYSSSNPTDMESILNIKTGLPLQTGYF